MQYLVGLVVGLVKCLYFNIQDLWLTAKQVKVINLTGAIYFFGW